MASKTQAVLLMGHGTRDLDGAAQFVDLLSAVRAAAGGVRVEAGFLEFGGPMLPFIRDAVDGLVADGVRELLAVPVLLHDANHTNADMPREARDAQARHPALRLVMSDALGISDALLDIVEGRFRDARLQLLDHEDAGTAMLLVGRGTSDAGANSDFFKIGRLLWERNRGLL